MVNTVVVMHHPSMLRMRVVMQNPWISIQQVEKVGVADCDPALSPGRIGAGCCHALEEER